MTRTRWLWLVAVAGLAIFAISFVQGWIVHERELRGEGYRFVRIFLSAWRGVAIPVTAAAAVIALAVASWAAARAFFGRTGSTAILVIGSAVVVGLIGASAVPVAQDGHASSVTLGPWWLLGVAVALGLLMLAGSAAAVRPSRRLAAAAAALAVIAFAGGAGGRWLGLQLAEGSGGHWEVGSYTRAAADGEPTETMTLTGASYRIGDRWSGAFESSGWTVVLDDDPACPGVRGTYHAHGENAADLRFVMVVDPCLEGERAADLETGIWLRDP